MSASIDVWSAIQSNPLSTLSVVTALGVFAGANYLIQSPRQRRKAAQTFTVKEICIYPIKSCYRVSLKSHELGPYGFLNDRRWMVVRSDGSFVTQRVMPKMALIKPSFEGDYMVINAPDMQPVKIPINGDGKRSAPLVQVRVWSDEMLAVDEGDEASAFFSTFLGTEGLRLVRMRDDHDRKIPEDYANSDKENVKVVSFADAFPVLMISEGSLQDLNQRMKEQHKDQEVQDLPMTRFRTNLIVEGTPFIEDKWKKIKIGEVTFNAVKVCSRCKETTVDQEKGEYTGAEPLQTLKTFRQGLLEGGSEVCFGQNLIHQNLGRVNVGDVIEVIR